MHLHLHIQETILDFGPVYSYWLFAFERYNGLLKNISTNGKDGFEATFMRCFIEDIYKSDFVNSALTCSTQAPFLSVLSKLVCSSTPVLILPSVSSTIVQPPFVLQAFVDSSETTRIPILGNKPLSPTSFPLSVSKPSSMGDIDYPHLLEYYKLAYLTPDFVHYQNAAASSFFVDNQIIKLKSINILGQVYYGNNGTTGRGSYVQSLFLGSNRSTKTTFTCQIKYIFIHSFTPPPMLPYYEADSTHYYQHVFAFVNWLPLLGDKS
ncbi:hypothetical protein PHYBLDRAFT_173437 [Phycomyces blakesleeanus NRRL 1555(-)]|uniref:Uncharacterized protein n=1 Tax=Phycomyces blakesleeanus (strain ATCC 8743b / DSM 1359 / FGSC 10004 / NBRC 33097 / NRRL 1555) TaxID=763407 RepID=A0A162ZQR0_PHYB8|nr:hypothetical protein PHYBLDRAFT_173437 [Phycomyces blakesleeanus NRRL 1555(-)]OAD68441.1 hypothetical protein PHYBLDRAFT_173437 [Phycomyces blakesleeanus NRRL 1555(-)]|eukprot:XP_018286481.1 hypothetical protein PHYBLDRAFT_173437 [Phycomyces blakesleeanus NRRL 1555(-)]